ncbi:MAG: hypothetical protein WAM69_00485 [Candidatus Sulfotelmatobacter sp.]
MIDRRDFLKVSALASTGALLVPSYASVQVQPKQIAIRTRAPDSSKTRLATRELLSGLRMLNSATEVNPTSGDSAANAALLTLALEPSRFKGSEAYEISASGNGAVLRASSEQALLYAVFDFLERQGLVFGVDGTTVPVDRSNGLHLPAQGQPWTASPRFAVRGLLPWPDFLNCISVYNEEDFKAYFAAMLRMRFNTFGMHVYTQNDPGPLAESYLSFDFAGSGHKSALEDTTMTSWGYLPQRTSTFKMGAPQFFDGETFGSDATRLGADTWDIVSRTTTMLRSAFDFAGELGIRTGIGFEPYQNPAEIVRALPPEALSHPGGFIESRTAHDLLDRRLGDLLEHYPSVDYVWLWQDENANWESRSKNVPLSITPFARAHDFLRRHAPKKRLVLAGWGGVTRHFESLHRRLPEDIVFAALNDSLGWDPVNEAFAGLGSRERWPIPWIEDDPSMWFPQFRASRFQADMKRAQDFGCQGVLGIHWRQRIIDPTATYLARASWDRQLAASAHYRSFCAAQASGARAAELATLFDDCDRSRAISSTFLGSYDKSGFANRVEITGDYGEAFDYATTQPDLAAMARQRVTAGRFRQLASQAASPLERDRIGYFAGFVGFMVPYCDAYETAHKLDAVLKHAVELRSVGKPDSARAEVMQRGVPLWCAMVPMVRNAMLEYQAVIATRDNLGQLASMQNKFVRIALERLRLSIKEFLQELPPEMDQAYAAAVSPESANSPRVFIPTRPSLLKAGESLRIFIVAPGLEAAGEVHLRTRRQNAQGWQVFPAAHAGRSVYAAQLGPFQADDGAIEYYAAAANNSHLLNNPQQTPSNVYTLNILA